MTDHVEPLALSAYADGELALEAVTALELHLAQCAACQAEVAQARRLSNRLQRLTARPVPAAFTRDAAALVAGRPQQAWGEATVSEVAMTGGPDSNAGEDGAGTDVIRPRWERWLAPAFALAAAAVLVVVALTVVCQGQPGLAACVGDGLAPRGPMAGGPAATAVPRYGRGAATERSAATRIAAGAPTSRTHAAAYPGPATADPTRVALGAGTPGIEAVAPATPRPPSSVDLGAGYPGPATPTTTLAPPARKTRAAAIAGLATQVVGGRAATVWLPVVVAEGVAGR